MRRERERERGERRGGRRGRNNGDWNVSWSCEWIYIIAPTTLSFSWTESPSTAEADSRYWISRRNSGDIKGRRTARKRAHRRRLSAVFCRDRFSFRGGLRSRAIVRIITASSPIGCRRLIFLTAGAPGCRFAMGINMELKYRYLLFKTFLAFKQTLNRIPKITFILQKIGFLNFFFFFNFFICEQKNDYMLEYTFARARVSFKFSRIHGSLSVPLVSYRNHCPKANYLDCLCNLCSLSSRQRKTIPCYFVVPCCVFSNSIFEQRICQISLAELE